MIFVILLLYLDDTHHAIRCQAGDADGKRRFSARFPACAATQRAAAAAIAVFQPPGWFCLLPAAARRCHAALF